MEIESKDVAAGGTRENPIFTERTIKGTARIQNNKTLLLASVAQGTEINTRSGLPLLGLIPILGRLFSAPSKDNRQVDIVIAVTPRVIRAPAILPDDEVERPTGSLAVPTNNTLEAMIVEEEQEELLAAARRIPNNPAVQLPDQASPAYVKTETAGNTAAPTTAIAVASTEKTAPEQPNPVLKPIDNGVKTLQLTPTSNVVSNPVEDTSPTQAEPEPQPAAPTDVSAAPNIQIRFGQDLPELKAGEKVKISVMVQSGAAFRSGVIGLKFDNKQIAVRSVSYGDVFGPAVLNTLATPFLNQNGKMYVSLTGKDETIAKPDGTLAFIEVEALTAGKPVIAFDGDVLNFLTADGKNFQIGFQK
jgi:hypothetical protein